LILRAQENERRRVARELHDGVIQLLSSVKFRLQSIEDRLQGAVDHVLIEDSKNLHQLLEKVIQEVRRISHKLRPSELDDLGLAAALRSLCGEFQERTGLAVTFSVAELPRALPDELELNFYRIVQEVLNNVERHAHASAVRISVTRDGSSLFASIEDNGGGFDLGQTRLRGSAGGGMGLMNIQERAASLGGRCEWESGPGDGTLFRVSLPLCLEQTVPSPKP
jgi:two-component system NarL family sensor kinase